MTNKTNTVALITGASHGLGLEVARQYASHGYRLILTARGEKALESAARELQGVTEVLATAGNVTDAAHVAALVQNGLDRFGHIDVLVNNASELGPSPMPALEAFPLDAFRAVLDVNVIAPLRLIQLVLPGMKARARGVIINVTSDAGVEAYAGWGGYGASKAALEHVSRTLAAELEGTGIAVVAIDPGDMDTRMHRDAEPGIDLSALPTPDVPAPAFLQVVETGASSGRLRALDFIEGEHHVGA